MCSLRRSYFNGTVYILSISGFRSVAVFTRHFVLLYSEGEVGIKKELSEWKKKLILFPFVLAALLAVGYVVYEMQGTIDALQVEVDRAHMESSSSARIIEKQDAIIRDLDSTLSTSLRRLSLLTTFRDAGFVVSSGDVRSLLDLANTLPYGSVFPGGHRITSEFGMRSVSRYGWVDQKHLGVDLIPLDGDPTVIMPVDGYITDWGFSETYGNFIEIRTTSGYKLFMAHLDHIYYPHVDEGGNWSIDPERIVNKGTRIGIMGMTGLYATGPHVHYEVWIQVESGWVPLDPEEIINFVGEIDD